MDDFIHDKCLPGKRILNDSRVILQIL